MKRLLRLLVVVLMVGGGSLLTGCAQIKLGAPQASLENVQKLKSAGAAPMATGDFRLADGKPRSLDEGISIRSNQVSSPIEGSFAKYLRETLAAELKGAGLLDPASKLVIEARLTDSQADAAMAGGSGRVAARFILKREGRVVYDRELAAKAAWESSFVGAVAIPAAVNNYGQLYKKLVGQLFDDPAFKAAVAR